MKHRTLTLVTCDHTIVSITNVTWAFLKNYYSGQNSDAYALRNERVLNILTEHRPRVPTTKVHRFVFAHVFLHHGFFTFMIL